MFSPSGLWVGVSSVDTGGLRRHTGRVAEVQGLDEIAKLLMNVRGVGRVIGARPRDGASCDVDFVILSRVAGGYLLRSATVDLNRLNDVRDNLFADPTPSTFTSENMTLPTLEDALQLAHSFALSTRADPLPGPAVWQKPTQFSKSLERRRVRSQILWLPQPPQWWHVTRWILTKVWFALAALLVIASLAVAVYLGPDSELVSSLVPLVATIGLPVVLLLVGDWLNGGLDRVECRLERHLDGPDASMDRPSHPQPTAGSGLSVDMDRRAASVTSGAAADIGVIPESAWSQSFMVHGRPRAGYLFGWLTGALAVGWSMKAPGAWGGEPPQRIWPLAVVLVLVSLLAAYRAYRRGVGADPTGVIVANFLRTHRIRWQDLRAISYRGRYSNNEEMVYALEFLLASGATVPATIPTGDGNAGGGLDVLRDRIFAVREAAFPGRFQRRQATDGKAQVVSVHRRRLESAAVEVAVVIRLSKGRYRHRRVGCRGSDLRSSLADLFDPHSGFFGHDGDASAQGWVIDQDFATPEEALLAAPREVVAPLGGWRDEVNFSSWVQGSEFSDSIRPEAKRVGMWGRVFLGAVAAAVLAGTTYAGYRFNAWVGLDTSQSDGWLVDIADTVVFVVIGAAALVLAVWVTAPLARVIAQRNLAAEAAMKTKGRGPTASRRAAGGTASIGRASARHARRTDSDGR